MRQVSKTSDQDRRLMLVKAVIVARHNEFLGRKETDARKLALHEVNLHLADCRMCNEHLHHLEATKFEPSLVYPQRIMQHVALLEQQPDIATAELFAQT